MKQIRPQNFNKMLKIWFGQIFSFPKGYLSNLKICINFSEILKILVRLLILIYCKKYITRSSLFQITIKYYQFFLDYIVLALWNDVINFILFSIG